MLLNGPFETHPDHPEITAPTGYPYWEILVTSEPPYNYESFYSKK